MPRSWSFSSAYTPPRRTLQSSSCLAAGSRVDALFELQTCATFIDDTVLCDTDECGVEDTMTTSRGAWTENENSFFHPCRSCHETHRLRNALKRIEGEYVAEIESLRVQLDEAAAQRAAAVRERNGLLASADAGATQMLEMEREVASLGLTVVKLSQEKEKLQLRVQELEKEGAAAREKHRRAARIVLEDTEAAERAHVEAAEKDQALLLRQLCLAESARVAAIAQVIYVNTVKRRAAAAGGVAADKQGSCCTSVSSGCTPEVSSRGLSEESRERRTSSPRPSQRRSMTAPVNTQRLADSLRSPRGSGGGEGAAATSRCTHLVDPAQTGARAAAGVDLAVEKIKRLERNLEQQRSAYEMQLAEERALTSEMQAEVDDLIESELLLLEANGRVVVERDWAEAVGDAVRYLLQSHRVALRSRQATSNEALMVDVTLSGASSVTSPRAGNGESGKRHLSAMTKQLSVAAEGFGVEPVVCEALLPDVLAGVEETRRGVHILHDSVTRCHAAVESTRTEQERMKALLHRLLAEVAIQRCRAKETQSTLGPIAHISAHSDDARLLSEGHEVTVKATMPATAVAQSGVDKRQPKGANSNFDLDPRRRLHTEAQRSSSAGDVTFLAHTDHISAAYVSDAFASRPSDVRLVEGGEDGLFDPHRIRLDADVVTQQMAALLSQDGHSESSDEDVSQTPYDAY
ncbi:hypothetical protein JIQ42_04425 [Leishmania sp. Namibia]|uniref:hypothetical protein n=1 Tax=Leishmania sp. Namibia TaxID=2802991 RepID=UPI001B50BE18|nr:hypothetical protein JIQ42_04425 [Leishmania sp. Namibia]